MAGKNISNQHPLFIKYRREYLAEEILVLICEPVDGDPGRYIVPGGTKTKCADCGREIYLSPSSQKLTDAVTVCMPCGLSRVNGDPEPRVEMVPGQAEEINAYHKRN